MGACRTLEGPEEISSWQRKIIAKIINIFVFTYMQICYNECQQLGL